MSQFSNAHGMENIQYGLGSIDSVDSSLIEDVPPAIPKKTKSRKSRHERQPSPYDNVPDNMGNGLIKLFIENIHMNVLFYMIF